jgi:hypothetical protein
MAEYDDARQAKTIHKAALLKQPNVVGVGIGYKVSGKRQTSELSVVVLVQQKLPPASLSAEAFIPQEVGGVRTDVLQVGHLRALQAPVDRWRPAPGGVSIGHFKVTAGTFGGVVYDQRSGERLLLSNNHVLANSNDARRGDPILQPAPYDGGQLARDQIASLERFVPIRYTVAPPSCSVARSYARLGNALARLAGSQHQVQVIQHRPLVANCVDAAVARPLDDNFVVQMNLEIGKISQAVAAELGMSVCKSGRSTAFTSGMICVLDATVVVHYGQDRTATFEEQIVTTPMSQGGDSGSLLVTSQGHQAVGLLFAGSAQSTLYNPIQEVLNQLNVSFADRRPRSVSAQQAAIARAQAVRLVYQDALLAKANVVGVGVGLIHRGGQRCDEVGLVVMVSRKVSKALLSPDDLIPAQIDAVPVDVHQTGIIDLAHQIPSG